MTTDLLLKILLGVAIPGVLGAIAMTWKASRDWTQASLTMQELTRQVAKLCDRVDTMNGQLDSIRLWRERHQATSDAQVERLDVLERAAR